VAEFLQTARGEDEASFVDVERVSGSIGGRPGTFVLQDVAQVSLGDRFRAHQRVEQFINLLVVS